MVTNEKSKREPLFHIIKSSDVKKSKAWAVRIIAGLLALLVCGIVNAILTKGNFAGFYTELFNGAFGTPRRIWNLMHSLVILLCIALAITPAFKMRFWNIGAEGQVLMGALGSVICIIYFGGKVPDAVLILIMFVFSIVLGAIWAVIPAIFKARWNTNETLFTLMMNYIAMNLVAYCINVWAPDGSGTIGLLKFGHFPQVGGQAYLLNIIIVSILTAVLYIYLKSSKHGYEISVVGQSEKTAKYIGINVRKVIIRTMILSGLMCGLAGLLLVGGSHHTINTNLAGGRGFTAILVSWLAQFNPIMMILTSFLVVFLQQGSAQVATAQNLGASHAYSSIIVGIFFFFIIGCEFFLNYKIKFRNRKGVK